MDVCAPPVCLVLPESRSGIASGTGVIDGCGHCGCWQSNFGSRQEQPKLVSAELSLHPQLSYLKAVFELYLDHFLLRFFIDVFFPFPFFHLLM